MANSGRTRWSLGETMGKSWPISSLNSLNGFRTIAVLFLRAPAKESTSISVILGYGLRQTDGRGTVLSRKENRGLGQTSEGERERERRRERADRSCGRQMVASRFVDNRFSGFPVYSSRRTAPTRCSSNALTIPRLIINAPSCFPRIIPTARILSLFSTHLKSPVQPECEFSRH